MNPEGVQSVTSDDGFRITSTTQTETQLKEQFTKAPEPPEPAPALEAKVEAEEPEEEPEAAQTDAEKAKEGKNKWSRRSATARVEQSRMELAREKARADEIERRAIAAEQELARIRGGSPALEPAKAEPAKEQAKADDGRPNPDNFEDWDKYQDALVDWKLEQRTKAAKEAEQRELMVQHQEAMFKDFQGRIDKALKADPTLDTKISPAVVALIPNGPVDLSKRLTNEQVLGLHFVSEEKGLDMMAYLSENASELQRLSTLPQGQLLKELGRIDARLGAATLRDTAPAPTQISRANPPVRPVTAVPPSGEGDPDPTLPFDQWVKQRERQEARERKARLG